MTTLKGGANGLYARLRPVSCALIAVVFLPVGIEAFAAGVNFSQGTETARQYGVHEVVLPGNGSVGNPFDTDVTVTFTPPSGTDNVVAVKAFYDGGDNWRARLYVSESGLWNWTSRSVDDEKLNGRSGSFDAVRSNLRGKIRSHPKNKRWWATDDGRTFLNLADTAYILFRSPNDPAQPVTDETFQQYVKANVRLGVTSMRAGGCGGYAGWSRFVRGVMPSYNRSNFCWEKDFSADGSNRYWERFDLDRFQTTDRRLRWLLDNYPDMYIQLIMGSKEGNRWFRIPEAYRRRTVAYMIARWSAWPQVYYEIVNDTQYTGPRGEKNQAMVREMAAFMVQMEPFGTLRSAGAKRDADNPFTLDSDWTWHTYFHTEETTEIDAHVCDHYYQEFNVPVHVYHGEDIYEQDNRSVEATLADPRYFFRRMFWAVLLSGGSPTYGGRYAVLHPYDATAGQEWSLQREKLVFDQQLVGLDDVMHVNNYFGTRNLDLALFTPDDAAVTAIPTPKPEPNGPSRAQCARRDREEYLIYLPCATDGELSGGGGGSPQQKSRGSCTVDSHKTPGVRVDLREATGTFRVQWYRTDDGTTLEGPSVEGGSLRAIASPWQGADVVARLWKPGDRVASTDIVPHRGGRADYPESTMYAYQRNLRDGVSLDADIRRTGDGDIVVIHDETTLRTCDQDLVVADTTVEKLKTLDAAYRFDPKRDETFPLRGQGITIPTLDEVFTVFVSQKQPGAIIWIDTKDDEDYAFSENQGLYDRLIELVGTHNLWEAAHIEVSTAEEAKALQRRNPRIRVVLYAAKEDAALAALSHACFARIGVPPAVATEVADDIRAAGKGIHVSKVRRSSWHNVRKIGPTTIGSDHYLELIEFLRSTGEMMAP